MKHWGDGEGRPPVDNHRAHPYPLLWSGCDLPP